MTQAFHSDIAQPKGGHVMRRISQQEWENEHMHNPMTEGEALAVLDVDAIASSLVDWMLTKAMPNGDLLHASVACDYAGMANFKRAVSKQLRAALTALTAASGGDVVGYQVCVLHEPIGNPSYWSRWQDCDKQIHESVQRGEGYYEYRTAKSRALYTAPPAAVPADALRDELTRLRQMTCKCVENNTRMNASESRTKGIAQAAQRLLSSLSPGLPLNHKARAAVRELAALIPKGADHGQR